MIVHHTHISTSKPKLVKISSDSANIRGWHLTIQGYSIGNTKKIYQHVGSLPINFSFEAVGYSRSDVVKLLNEMSTHALTRREAAKKEFEKESRRSQLWS